MDTTRMEIHYALKVVCRFFILVAVNVNSLVESGFERDLQSQNTYISMQMRP